MFHPLDQRISIEILEEFLNELSPYFFPSNPKEPKNLGGADFEF
jgi:hypothetical protein